MKISVAYFHTFIVYSRDKAFSPDLLATLGNTVFKFRVMHGRLGQDLLASGISGSGA